VEISWDKKHMRTRTEQPGMWSLAGLELAAFSTLDASVPEFMPRQMFRVPATTESNAADVQQPEMRNYRAPPVMDIATKVPSEF